MLAKRRSETMNIMLQRDDNGLANGNPVLVR